MFDRIVLSCEHAGNHIPARYIPLFKSADGVLEGHLGYDLGALEVARYLARKLGVELFSGRESRLLVDLNRSLGHSALFSRYLRELDLLEKTRILERYYHPFRHRVEIALRSGMSHRVLHLGIHSFTPILDGTERRADVGLLYDPTRAIERDACARILKRLHRIDPTLAVRRNYPYRGTADGFTTHLRKALRSDGYAGIEIELNQKRTVRDRDRRQIGVVLGNAIRDELSLSRQP